MAEEEEEEAKIQVVTVGVSVERTSDKCGLKPREEDQGHLSMAKLGRRRFLRARHLKPGCS